jgi:hypothetical protein
MNNSQLLYNFFTKLRITEILPDGIEILNPYANKEVLAINKSFYDKYYNDNNKRVLAFGINPGRFGAGLTGIAFTDAKALEENLKIKNNLNKKPELSATFIHKAINAYGGPTAFYNNFLVTAVSPLGFIKNGININYYDEPALQKALLPFIKQTISQQYELTGKRDICVTIGKGTNLKFLSEINRELKLFRKIIPLGHPRWIMQYQRKREEEHIKKYVQTLNEITLI